MSTLMAPVRFAVSLPKSFFSCSGARVRHLSSPFRRGNELKPTSMSFSVESEACFSKEDDALAVEDADIVIQYVVLRRDLIDSWPLGSVVTQGCHASVAAIWSHKDDPHTTQYCSPENIDSMHKVTLEVKGATQILNLSEKLTAGGIPHKLWIEQPENIPTCLATKPHPKSKEEYANGDEVGGLECKHWFHGECIQQWLRQKNWCPICKASAELRLPGRPSLATS